MSYVQFPKAARQKSVKSSIVALSLLGAFTVATSASADQYNGLEDWAKAADAAIDDVMVYPYFAARRGHSGRSEFSVTIDGNGNIVTSNLMATQGDYRLKSAARKVLKNVDLPPIPAGYEGKRLKFSLYLNYVMAGSAFEAKSLMRETEVRGEPVPYASSSMGRITVLSDVAD